MVRTYDAILNGERLTWIGKAPHGAGPVRVKVEVESSNDDDEHNGVKVAEAMRRAAAEVVISSIADPVAWQREQRMDRPMPGREP